MDAKLAFLVLFLSFSAGAKPLVLISYFDAFGRASFNNSEKVAASLAKELNRPESAVSAELCELNTVFDKSYAQLESCLTSLPKRPAMVLALGETGCKLKLEILARNKDKTSGPDNEGNHRRNTPIIPEGPQYLPFHFPVPQMYCALDEKDRKSIIVSNNAGSFVCNNLAYQTSYHYPELVFGFIHVPSNNCREIALLTKDSVRNLKSMILRGIEFLDTQYFMPLDLPHSSNEVRLPFTKEALHPFRQNSDPCLKEFFGRAQGVDERSVWPFSAQN